MAVSIEDKLAGLDAKVSARQRLVLEAFAKHLPEFPLDLLRETFGAKIQYLRSQTVNYGYPETLPGEVCVPVSPKVIKYSRRGRALFDERVNPPLKRVGRARKMQP